MATHRIRSASATVPNDSLRILPSSNQYEPIALTTPKFFIDRPDQTSQLKDYLQNPGLRPFQSKIVEASWIRVAIPSMVHRWRRFAFLEGLFESEHVLCHPREFLDFETLPFRRASVRPASVLLALPLYSNFYHWTVELLPRLQLLDEHRLLDGLPLIVPADAPSFVKETLRLSGYLDRAQFLSQGVYAFERLYIPSLLSTASHPSPKAIAWLRDKFPPVPLSESRDRKRRIYVSRRDAPARRVTNESAVEATLREYGFETIAMSEYTIDRQIEIFSQAEIVVGIHGAALTNLAFCSSGTSVLEIFQRGWVTNAYYHISLIRKLHYGYLVCEKVANGIFVPCDALDTLINEILKSGSVEI